jgi:myosin heavy subunit
MVAGFSSKLKANKLLGFDKHNQDKFMIRHSQADVFYSAKGFKAKNQDKIIT